MEAPDGARDPGVAEDIGGTVTVNSSHTSGYGRCRSRTPATTRSPQTARSTASSRRSSPSARSPVDAGVARSRVRRPLRRRPRPAAGRRLRARPWWRPSQSTRAWSRAGAADRAAGSGAPASTTLDTDTPEQTLARLAQLEQLTNLHRSRTLSDAEYEAARGPARLTGATRRASASQERRRFRSRMVASRARAPAVPTMMPATRTFPVSPSSRSDASGCSADSSSGDEPDFFLSSTSFRLLVRLCARARLAVMFRCPRHDASLWLAEFVDPRHRPFRAQQPSGARRRIPLLRKAASWRGNQLACAVPPRNMKYTAPRMHSAAQR